MEQQNDSNIISETRDIDFSEGNVKQHDVNYEETDTYFESLLHNFKVELDKCVMVKRNYKAEIERLTTELAQYKGQQKFFENNEKKYNELKLLSKQETTYSKLEKVRDELKSKFEKCKDELLEQIIELEHKIKELNKIIVKTEQSVQTIHMFSPKPDSFNHNEYKMALGYQNPLHLKKAQRTQCVLYDGKVLSKYHDPIYVYGSEETLKLADESP
ncbi:hypothetical protein Tco_1165160 [Tanacetum coccineum]